MCIRCGKDHVKGQRGSGSAEAETTVYIYIYIYIHPSSEVGPQEQAKVGTFETRLPRVSTRFLIRHVRGVSFKIAPRATEAKPRAYGLPNCGAVVKSTAHHRRETGGVRLALDTRNAAPAPSQFPISTECPARVHLSARSKRITLQHQLAAAPPPHACLRPNRFLLTTALAKTNTLVVSQGSPLHRRKMRRRTTTPPRHPTSFFQHRADPFRQKFYKAFSFGSVHRTSWLSPSPARLQHLQVRGALDKRCRKH